MKEFVEKLIGRLEELGWVFADYYPDGTAINRKRKKSVAYDDVISIANQLAEEYKDKDCSQCSRRSWYQKGYADAEKKFAEEYNNGWIPYVTNEELPTNGQKVWLSFTNEYTSFVKSAYWIYDHFEWANGKKVKDFPSAWKPYKIPEPYQKEGE